MRRPAGLEQVDDALGFGREVQGGHRAAAFVGVPFGVGKRVGSQQGGQGGGSDPGGGTNAVASAAKQLAAGQQQFVFSARVHVPLLTHTFFYRFKYLKQVNCHVQAACSVDAAFWRGMASSIDDAR